MLKTEFVPISIIDNFFKDPNYIRQKALKYDYFCKGNWPGQRTESLHTLDFNLYQLVSSKLFSIFVDNTKEQTVYEIDIRFQYTTKDFENGWAHTDEGYYMAGVIYLTPNPPNNTGTIIYNNPPKNYYVKAKECSQIKNNFYENKIKSKDYEEMKKYNNDCVSKSIEIENVYNRAVIYPANYWHSQNKFFGNCKEDARLTLVFFLNSVSSTATFPIDRINKNII
jgi:hypothetical protein